ITHGDQHRVFLMLLHVPQFVRNHRHCRHRRHRRDALRKPDDVMLRVVMIGQLTRYAFQRNRAHVGAVENPLRNLDTAHAGAVSCFAPLAVGGLDEKLRRQRKQQRWDKYEEKVIRIETQSEKHRPSVPLWQTTFVAHYMTGYARILSEIY